MRRVWGCADSTARKWWSEGCRTIDDVRNKASGLTAIQQIGLKYYDDFLKRMPRAEVAEAVSIIQEAVLSVLQASFKGHVLTWRADHAHLLTGVL